MVFFIINFIENITHRAGWLGRPPPPGCSAPAAAACCAALCPINSELCQFCPALLLFCPIAIPQKPYNTAHTGRNTPRMRYFVLRI